MHPPFLRFQVENQSGVTATVTLKYRGKKFDANGALTYGSSATLMNSQAVTTGSVGISSSVDNVTDAHLEGEAEIRIVTTGNPAGDVFIYLQRSLDGVAWPDDMSGQVVRSQTITAEGTNISVVPAV